MERIEEYPMDHTEAVQEMATERYLLDELTAEQRDAFEEHLFDCQECALDLRTATTFVQEAKTQLPALTADFPRREAAVDAAADSPKSWFAWLTPLFRPALAGPVFAAMLVIIGYQNVVMVPALRVAASEPHVTPWTLLHTDTRGGAATPVPADPKAGVVLLVDLPTDPGYRSYSFALTDPGGKTAWTLALAAPRPNADGTYEGAQSLTIPGAGLQNGAYTLTVFGITSAGARSEIQRHVLDLRVQP